MSELKEMKKLSRRELLDIIYEMKKNELSLQQRLDEAEAELNKKEVLMQNAGSIAEASLALSNIFEAAQHAADTYVRSVQSSLEDQRVLQEQTEQKRSAILQEANAEAEQIRRGAELECQEMWKEAKAKIKEREERFCKAIVKFMDENPELRTVFMNQNG